MSSDFDKDLAFEDESLDVYQQGSGKPSDDEEEDEPSVEDELAAQESGLLDDKEKKVSKKKDTGADVEADRPKTDLELIEEAEREVEGERDALLAENGEDEE